MVMAGEGEIDFFSAYPQINSQSVVHVAHSSSRNLPYHTISVSLYPIMENTILASTLKSVLLSFFAIFPQTSIFKIN